MTQTTLDISDLLSQSTTAKDVSSPLTSASGSRLPFLRARISNRDRIEFCTQLSVMLSSGVPLHRALGVIEAQSRKNSVRSVVNAIRTSVDAGRSLSRAMSSQPGFFDELFVVTTNVGEETGKLGEILSSLGRHLEKIDSLRKKLLQALTYPALVLFVAAGAVGFLLLFIVPTFADMFKSFQMDLPWSSQLVVQASDLLAQYGLLIPAAVLPVLLLVSGGMRSRRFVQFLDNESIRLPLLGQMIIQNHVARLCRTLGVLLESGVTLVDALVTARRVIRNQRLTDELDTLIRSVRSGETMTRTIGTSSLFPPMVAQMLTVGEETSELDRMLLRVADHFENEIDRKIDVMSTAIEPVIILLVGALVGSILIAMYLPMFDIAGAITASQ